MHSTRFDLPVVLTEHARVRMAERSMTTALILEIIDTGTHKDAGLVTAGCTSILTTVQTICSVWPL